MWISSFQGFLFVCFALFFIQAKIIKSDQSQKWEPDKCSDCHGNPLKTFIRKPVFLQRSRKTVLWD